MLAEMTTSLSLGTRDEAGRQAALKPSGIIANQGGKSGKNLNLPGIKAESRGNAFFQATKLRRSQEDEEESSSGSWQDVNRKCLREIHRQATDAIECPVLPYAPASEAISVHRQVETLLERFEMGPPPAGEFHEATLTAGNGESYHRSGFHEGGDIFHKGAGHNLASFFKQIVTTWYHTEEQ